MKDVQGLSSNPQAGFTLIEVLIAVAIFTLGILSVNAMQIASIKGNSSASDLTEIATDATDQVELILGENYDDIAASVTGDVTVNVSPDDPFEGLMTITVSVQRQVRGGTKTVTMTYVKADSV
ncbi:MAG: prepilin-type N-terminal cleavage/methylation domain-containing protein [Desulfobulbaceae bacterium]|nr:prepilin-type N-terminal cleavage/methylation domain-containing protein [Desulfobulbaceae bacterium]